MDTQTSAPETTQTLPTHPPPPPMATHPVNTGDVLLVPAPTEDITDAHRCTIQWQQGFSQKSAKYIALSVVNKNDSTGETTMYVQAEWYNDTFLHKACGAKDGKGDYEFRVDKRLQYGQKDKQGTGRFVVWHDESRKPYQHRFIQSSLGSLAANAAAAIAGLLGYKSVADAVKGVGNALIGDYLRTFEDMVIIK